MRAGGGPVEGRGGILLVDLETRHGTSAWAMPSTGSYSTEQYRYRYSLLRTSFELQKSLVSCKCQPLERAIRRSSPSFLLVRHAVRGRGTAVIGAVWEFYH
jgi:hypothetical protein